MSKEENRKMISAYEQMLKDGSAFKQVDMTMHSQPDIAEATGSRGGEPINTQISDNPMGQPLDEQYDDGGGYRNNDQYTEFDSVMEQRMNSLRNKIRGKSGGTSTSPNQNREIASLKKRVARLEEALALVMETHEKLLG